MSRTEISPAAKAAISRLHGFSHIKPRLDRPTVETAMRAHLEALGMANRPVVWVDDAAAGYKRVTDAAWDAARDAARDAAWDAAWGAARGAAWDAARGAARDAAWDAAWGAAMGAAWDAARGAAWGAARDVARDAARGAAQACAELNALAAFDHPTQHKLVGFWLPMIDAFEVGLFLYWITPTEIVCVPAPSLSITDNRLHREDGPAVEWPSGERYWFWKGLRVTQWIIETPEKITAELIRTEKNAEFRRVMMERFGYGRYVKEMGGTMIHEDHTGKLWLLRPRSQHELPAVPRRFSKAAVALATDTVRVLPPQPDEIAVVEVVNGSKEPDGTYKTYYLSVPPKSKTALEAVAWTYGMTSDEYRKLVVRT